MSNAWETVVENGSATKWPSRVVIHTDGASRGNPGPASLGITVSDLDGEVIYELGAVLGMQTNNVAEYRAVEAALDLAASAGVDKVTLKSDSQLLIRQLTGEYKVKSELLQPIFKECLKLQRKIGSVNFQHVRREENRRADQLANMALDGGF